MTTPVRITFRQMDSSPALEALVHEEVESLERLHPAIRACEVAIEAPHRHKSQGRRFHVRVELAVPGGKVVASRDPDLDSRHEDAPAAVRDAFRVVRRELATRSDQQQERTP